MKNASVIKGHMVTRSLMLGLLLTANALWDAACAACVLLELLDAPHRRVWQVLSEVHLRMLTPESRQGRATSLFLAGFLLHQAFLRVLPCLMLQNHALHVAMLAAAWSYALEAACMTFGIIADIVDPLQGWSCVAMCASMFYLIVHV